MQRMPDPIPVSAAAAAAAAAAVGVWWWLVSAQLPPHQLTWQLDSRQQRL
jgi:hypothetical protein